MGSSEDGWEVSLLKTKFHVPRLSSETLVRTRLFGLLNTGLNRKMTLVSAPAGFGKTTLVNDWLRSLKNPYAWLCLDFEDNDPGQFWRYVTAALQMIDADVGEPSQIAIGAVPTNNLERYVRELINDIVSRGENKMGITRKKQETEETWILVLEDYHVIESEKVHTSLNFFIDHLPAWMHVIITTRADPPLNLARRRARQTLVEVRTVDLSFTVDEVEHYVNSIMVLDLTAEQIANLEKRTEGWIVGLQLAALSMKPDIYQGRGNKSAYLQAFTGGDRYIGDYLLNEVLQSLPARIQTFLCQTSILNRFCASLCDEVLDDISNGNEVGGHDPNTASQFSPDSGTASQQILEYLEKANLFLIPLDGRRKWYRYHQLFRDLLHQRLLQSEGRNRIEALHKKASEWFERHGDFGDAVAHAMAATDDERAGDMLQKALLASGYADGDLALVYRWLVELPEAIIQARPALCIADARRLSTFQVDGIQRAEQRLNTAQRLLETASQPVNDNVLAGLEAQIIELQVVLASRRGDRPADVVQECHRALASLKDGNTRLQAKLYLNQGQSYLALGKVSLASRALVEAKQAGQLCGDENTSMHAVCLQANVIRRQGRLQEAAALLREALRSTGIPADRTNGGMGIYGYLYASLGRIHLAQNHLQKAEKLLRMGIEQLEETSETMFMADANVALARVISVQGQQEAALMLLEKIPAFYPGAEALVETERVRHWLYGLSSEPSAVQALQQWVEGIDITLDDLGEVPAVLHEDELKYDKALTLARVQVALRRIERQNTNGEQMSAVLRFLDQQLNIARTSGWLERAGELLILQALTFETHGDYDQSLAALGLAFEIFGPQEHVRVFIDEGEAIAGLLYLAVKRGLQPRFTRELLAAIEIERGRRINQVSYYKNASWQADSKQEIIDPLSNRETEVLQLIASGLTSNEIAQNLYISPGTVKVHINHIYNKLRVHKRMQAVAKGRFYGILTPL